jgi:hypothetical protein
VQDDWKGGRHLVYADKPSMANLLVTLMDKLDVPVEKIGGSTATFRLMRYPACRNATPILCSPSC